MQQESSADISFFQRYLTVWVFLCMVAGVLLMNQISLVARPPPT